MTADTRQPGQEPPRASLAHRNRIVGFTSLAVGAGSGLIMGLWSFDGPVTVPGWLGEYGDTSRRLFRLGHIAFFGLGILNLLLAQELVRRSSVGRLERAASLAMNFGNVFLPTTLWAAAILHPLKYLMPLPATSVLLAMLLMVYRLIRHELEAGDAHS